MRVCDLFPTQTRTFSFEFFPPKTVQDAEALFARARELHPLGPTFISVTYGAGGSTRQQTIDLVCRFQEELGLVAMAHLTCVGHSQTELREILTGRLSLCP
jgi:methylenetetrahydrofolate reductase (NADPH)